MAKVSSQFIDEKIQMFHCGSKPGDCFRCDPAAPYQFLTECDPAAMVRFSSSWFSGVDLDYNPKIPPKNDWFPEDRTSLTDIGFIENVPTYKYYIASAPKKSEEADFLRLPLLQWKIPPRRIIPSPVHPVKKIISSKLLKKMNEKLTNSKFDHVTKLATSRFGRTRKVIDFSVFVDGE